jgi:hypothetical protein
MYVRVDDNPWHSIKSQHLSTHTLSCSCVFSTLALIVLWR